MNCDDILNVLDSLIDNEADAFSTFNREAVESHIRSCAACRSELELRQQQSIELRDSFLPQRVMAENVHANVMETLRSEAETAATPGQASVQQSSVDSKASVISNASSPPVQRLAIHSRPQPFGWLHLLSATAAGFFLAVIIFQPWRIAPDPNVAGRTGIVPQRAFGMVAVSTGDIELRDTSGEDWYGWSEDLPVPVDAKLRTGSSIGCELLQQDGACVRFGEKTEVMLADEKSIELNEGRMYYCLTDPVSASQPVSVKCGDVSMEVVSGAFDLTHFENKTELMAVNEPVVVRGDGWTETVAAGHVATINADGTFVVTRIQNPLLETSWIHPILMEKKDHRELNQRVSQMLAEIGESKLDHLYEDEIRAVGAAAIDPLIAYLSSDDPGHQNQSKRAQAATIVSDLATRKHAMQMVGLLDDADPDVTRLIESGLERITGRKIENPQKKVRAPDVDGWRRIIESA